MLREKPSERACSSSWRLGSADSEDGLGGDLPTKLRRPRLTAVEPTSSGAAIGARNDRASLVLPGVQKEVVLHHDILYLVQVRYGTVPGTENRTAELPVLFFV